MSLRFYPRAELGKEGGNNLAPTPTRRRIKKMQSKGLRSHASTCGKKKGCFCKTKPPSPRAGGSSLVPPNRLEENGVVRWFQPPRERKYRV